MIRRLPNTITEELNDRACHAMPITPYQRGFEHLSYYGEYANPYKVGSSKWREYDRGVQDANRSRRDV